MDGTRATPVQAATAIQAKIPGLVPKTPAPPLAPLPALPPISAKSELTSAKAELTTACPRQAQWALGILLVVTGLLLAAHTFRTSALGPRISDRHSGEPLTYKLDINQASESDLIQVPGIGPELAKRIVEDRVKNGPFQTIEDLKKIKGIKDSIFKRVQNWICVNDPEEGNKPTPEPKNFIQMAGLKPQQQAPPKILEHKQANPPANPKKEAAWDGALLDLNTASAEQLDKLPRIGSVLSKRIIEERNLRPFKSVDDLKRVKGIGQKTLAGLRPYVTVGK